MALRDKAPFVIFIRFLLTLLLLISIVIVAAAGGFLNRCRGGYLDYGKHLGYWPAHIISRQTFSLATGLLVWILGFHLRAGVVVWLLTQWSLYIGWGSYFMIGAVPTNYESREGIFDWMLGRQEADWNYTHRFVREYSGMSLRGLIWTIPQGYALQQLGFGWQYSLTGSLMGLVYFTGGHSHLSKHYPLGSYFTGAIPFSEFYWGTWVWLVLIVSCLTQGLYRIRKWVYFKNSNCARNPFKKFEVFKFESLNYRATNVAYNIFMVIFWLILGASTVFYSLIVQTDTRNKGQTFFGLFMSVVALTFFLSWTWSALHTQRVLAKERRMLHEKMDPFVNRHLPPRINDIDRLEQVGGTRPYHPSETDPLLPWPYSHPDKGFIDQRRSPVHEANRSSTPMGFSHSPNLTRHTIPHLQAQAMQRQPLTSTSYAFLLLWPTIEKWLYLDILAWLRHIIGLVSLLSTVFTVVLCFVAVVWDRDSPVFDPEYYVCVNGSVWNYTAF